MLCLQSNVRLCEVYGTSCALVNGFGFDAGLMGIVKHGFVSLPCEGTGRAKSLVHLNLHIDGAELIELTRVSKR
jgi:hypothetical protein